MPDEVTGVTPTGDTGGTGQAPSGAGETLDTTGGDVQTTGQTDAVDAASLQATIAQLETQLKRVNVECRPAQEARGV